MPKSKRSKVGNYSGVCSFFTPLHLLFLVSLAKTVKKSKERKQDLIREIKESVDLYSHIYVFSVSNMRNNRLKDLRVHWQTSRCVFGFVVISLLPRLNPFLQVFLWEEQNDNHSPRQRAIRRIQREFA